MTWLYEVFVIGIVIIGVYLIGVSIKNYIIIDKKSHSKYIDIINILTVLMMKPVTFLKLHNGGEDPNAPIGKIEYYNYFENCNFWGERNI